ncbi:MAG: DUF4870 domain-containing protein [Anaerolineae bacterium]|nr:DUF4870 domain-containing protein [Anaerolineae bacterium]
MTEHEERNQEMIQEPEAPAEPTASEAIERFSTNVKETSARADLDGEAAQEVVEEYESKYYGSGRKPAATQEAAQPPRPAKPAAPPPPPPPPARKPKDEGRAITVAQPLSSEDERLWAALAHATVPLTLLLGIFSAGVLLVVLIFAPLAIYFWYRDRSRFVAYHALQAFVMQLAATFGVIGVAVVGAILLALAIAVSGVLSIVLIGIPFLIVFVLVAVVFAIAMIAAPFVMAVYALVAAAETYNGRDFRYKWIGDWVEQWMAKA